MVNVGNTKNLFSLLRKEIGIEISKLSKEGLKDFKVPDNAISYDAVKVGQKANPTTHYTDVYIFRDKDGNVVSTVHNKINADKIKQTVKKYSESTEDTLYIDRGEYDDVIPIKRQIIRGYVKENGSYTKCFEEHRALSEDKKMMESLDREMYPGSEETITVSRFETGEKPKYVKNRYKKIPVGKEFENFPVFIRERQIQKALREPGKYAGSYELTESKISDEELKELAQHPYFLPYFGPDKKFIYRMSREVEKEKMSLPKRINIVPYSEKSTTGGFYRPAGFNDYIHINRINKKGSPKTRAALANVIGHEFGHADWEHKVLDYEAFGEECFGESSDTLKKQIEKIKKYKEGNNNYVLPEENMEKYRENFTEIMARHEGRETTDKYDKLESITDKYFPAVRGVYKKDLEAEADTSSYFLYELLRDIAKYGNELK